MPQINSIPEVLYGENQPYHHMYDNLPLKNILTRIGLVNIQVDINTDVLRGAAGSVGSLNSRLDVSLNENGSLKTNAVDGTLHSIESHEDTDSYVRMKIEERNKLGLVLNGANNFDLEIESIGSLVNFPPKLENGTLRLERSPSIFFEFKSPNTLVIHSAFPPDVAHRHHYDVVPAYQGSSVSDPNYFKNYKTTILDKPFKEGTLRVYVNGMRLTDEGVLVANYSSSSTSWSPTYVSAQNANQGTFELNRSLSPNDVIRIDFDEMILPPQAMSSSSSSGSVSSSSSSSSS